MKIAVICRGRTCSTAVIGTLANNFSCRPIGENFQPHSYVLRNRYPNQQRDEIFKMRTLKLHKNLLFQKRFVAKIWPSMLIPPPDQIQQNETFIDFEHKIIFDIEKYLFLSKYDKLYFLDRDLYESTFSWVYAKKTSKFHNIKNFNQNYSRIELNDSDYATAKFYILEYCLQQKIKDYLLDSKISYTDISEKTFEFDDLPIKKSNNDYTNLIIGADNLKKFIDKQYQICVETTKNWKFF
jgi:hypothetical protein